MSVADKICPRCGTPADAIARFCGGCGSDMASAPPAGAVAGAKGADPKSKTAFGLPAMQLPPELQPQQPAPVQQPELQPQQPAPVQQQPQQPAPPRAKKRDMAQTMLGMPATTVGSVDAPSASHESRPRRAGPGLGAGGGFAPVEGSAPTQAMPMTPSPLAQPQPQRVAPKQNRTMLGMEAMGADPAMASAASPAPGRRVPSAGSGGREPAHQAPAHRAPAPQSAAAKVAAKSNRTMLGMVVAPGAAAPTTPGAHSDGAPARGYEADTWPDEPARAPLRSRRWMLWLFLGVLVLGALGVAVGILLMGDSAPDVRATVVPGEGEGEVLQVDVPGAPAGTKVRFDGREVPTTAGRAVFPLGANALQLGDNSLTVEVVSPTGEVDAVPLVLTVRYRVRPDLDGLDDAEPRLRIVVDAVPGSVVTLDETPIALDVTGHGVHDVPVAGATDSNLLEETFDYRVVPPGGAPPAQGQVRVRVPFATLQVERPSTESITDRPRLEIAGAAHSDATVTVDGQPVPVREGRFLAEIEVPLGVSEHVVVATSDERAPRRVDLTVRRVANLAAEAASFDIDESLDYARLAAAPNDYRGRKVAYVGRVYNADVHDGRATLQLVVRDCARGQRCPLWVRHDGGTQVRINQWVRVLGEVVGEQQYRATSGEVRSDPAVEAAFLLPVDDD